MTAPDPQKRTSSDAVRATPDVFGHPPPTRPLPLRIDVVRIPVTLVPIDVGSDAGARTDGRRDRRTGSGTISAWLFRLGGLLLPSWASRPPDAGSLTDRQLADIGLARRDVEAHPGWRGREPAMWGSPSQAGGSDRDR